MTDRIALVLGLVILSALTLDVVLNGSEHLVFLGQKMFDFIEWLAFWR
ncbi:hypothetical protein [Antarcticimicrobium sediminis]|nr:hypothetical protein [Antarcticimicrobium sediminis]